jgi:hypothetical protein
MNKETTQIRDYITQSGYYLDKVDKLRKKFNNIKDFQVMFGYVVMEIVSEEKKFMNMSRKNIDLPVLSQMYFGG